MTNLSRGVIDVLFWPFTQIAISALIVRLPNTLFTPGEKFFSTGRTDLYQKLYRKLAVRRWKKMLPDGATWIGGRPKRVKPFDPADALIFLGETRRAKVAHWLQLACAALCWSWNPRWAATVMTAYALLANLPCILVQNCNQALLQRRYSKIL